jgi:hypothetical protein
MVTRPRFILGLVLLHPLEAVFDRVRNDYDHRSTQSFLAQTHQSCYSCKGPASGTIGADAAGHPGVTVSQTESCASNAKRLICT